MPEIGLDAPGVLPCVRQVVAGTVPEHVRVDLEVEACCLTSPRYELLEARDGEGGSTLGYEDEGGLGASLELPEGPKLTTGERMDRGCSVLSPADVKPPSLEFDLVPTKIADLRSP